MEKYEQGQICKKNNLCLIPEILAFKNAIEEDPVLRMGFNGALESIPEGGVLHGQCLDEVLETINGICISAPKFYNNATTCIPFYTLFIDFMNTRYGQAFFSNPIVNHHLKNIFNAYSTMLQSKISLEHLNEQEPFGWLCPTAQKYVNWSDYYINTKKPHWGFKSWN